MEYSKTAVTWTQMPCLPWLIQTRFLSAEEILPIAKKKIYLIILEIFYFIIKMYVNPFAPEFLK